MSIVDESTLKTCPHCGSHHVSAWCPRCGGDEPAKQPFGSSEQLPDEGPESALQSKIEAYLDREGLFYFHDRSRRCNRPGFPDLVVALPGGRVLWLELKSKHGRLSHDQQRVRLMLMALGQEWHEVRSFGGFLNVVQKGEVA